MENGNKFSETKMLEGTKKLRINLWYEWFYIDNFNSIFYRLWDAKVCFFVIKYKF